MQRITELETVLRYHSQRSADEIREKELHWREVVMTLESQLSEARLKPSPTAAIKQRALDRQLEGENHREQTQYALTNKPLKDRTNTARRPF